MSADGKTIVYEDNFGIWKLDLESGRSGQIPITINSDTKDNDTELRIIQSASAKPSASAPSGKAAAIIATHGEVFSPSPWIAAKSKRVTETPCRDGRRPALVPQRQMDCIRLRSNWPRGNFHVR